MSYEDKIRAAQAAIADHNKVVGEAGTVNAEQFLQKLKLYGGTSDERLISLSHEDLATLMPDFSGVKPMALVRNLARIFREGLEVKIDTPRYVSGKKAERMSPRELVENFDPEETDNPVGKRLTEISKGKPFIVFSDGRTVHVQATTDLLQELKRGYEPRQTYEVDGNIKAVYAIGNLPDPLVDEDPLYPNRPLRPDGTSDQTGRSWEGVPLNVRQLIRIAMVVKDIVNLDIEKAHTIQDLAIAPDAFNKLRSRYRKAAVGFDRLSDLDQLPRLKIQIKAVENRRPFDRGVKVDLGPKAPPVPPAQPLYQNSFAKYDAEIGQWVQQSGLIQSNYKYDGNTSSWTANTQNTPKKG